MTTTSIPTDVADDILNILESRGRGDYIGESISQLEHSLQAAQLAASSKASADVVIAALLHDIGQFLPIQDVVQLSGEAKSMQTEDEHSVGRVGHEKIGELYLLQRGFSSDVAALVGSHVAAKRYLCAVEPAYHDTLSDASKKSLVFQGGPMSDTEVKEWSNHPWCQDMCRLRKWDDAAKIVDLEVPPAQSYRDMIIAHLEGRSL